MLPLSQAIRRLRGLNEANGGVYSAADLSVLLERPRPQRLTESIRILLREEVLLRVRRGLYVDCTHGYRPEILGQRWLAPSYLSTETALSQHQLCDTGIAAYTYVTTRLLPHRGAGRKIFDDHQFIYRHVARHLFFGHRVDDGIRLAEPEKAVLDFLYFIYKKQQSVLAPGDIDFSPLNPSRYRRFLGAFRQRGFDEFALRWWKERRGRQ